MRFLCDAMLARLARWLRAAGHDAALAGPGLDDRAVVAQALAEERLLVTRDRAMTTRRAVQGRILLLESDALDDWMAQLKPVLPGGGWTHRPFTRCLLCNQPLQPPPAAALDRLPDHAADMAPRTSWCDCCGRLYWPGSHTRRMQDRLRQWQAQPAPPLSGPAARRPALRPVGRG